MRAELLRIDFLARPGRPALGIAVLLVGVLLVGASVERWRRVDAARMALENGIAAREEARRRAAAPRPIPAPTLMERREAQAIRLASQPWVRTLRAIERATEPPIHLLALTFAPGSESIRIEGEAPAYADVLDYIRALDGGDQAFAPRLVSHGVAPADAHGPARLRFAVVADRRTR